MNCCMNSQNLLRTGGETVSLIIKIDEIKTEEHLKKAIPYILNEKKTKGLSYSNSGITSDQIVDMFMLTKKIHPCRGNREGYHLKFSFSKDERITPQEAYDFIKEWVDEYLNEKYDFACSVHQDREHMHMHLVFNSVCREGGKFRYNKGDWDRVIKPLTNRLAEKYHTGSLREKDEQLDYSRDYDRRKNGRTGKEQVQTDMDQCVLQSTSYHEFKKKMVQDFQYQLREGVSKEHGVYLALTPPGRAKAVRTYQLDFGYMPAEIEQRLEKKKKMDFHDKPDRRMHTMEWMMSRNYAFIPYQELSEYQKAMVRKVLEAKRLYRRRGTSLQLHEQSCRAVKSMMKEISGQGHFCKMRQNNLGKVIEQQKTIQKGR